MSAPSLSDKHARQLIRAQIEQWKADEAKLQTEVKLVDSEVADAESRREELMDAAYGYTCAIERLEWILDDEESVTR